MYVHTYIHSYIHTYIHTYICTYVCTYLPTYLPTYIHSYIHTYIHTIHTYIHTYIRTYMSWIVHCEERSHDCSRLPVIHVHVCVLCVGSVLVACDVFLLVSIGQYSVRHWTCRECTEKATHPAQCKWLPSHPRSNMITYSMSVLGRLDWVQGHFTLSFFSSTSHF